MAISSGFDELRKMKQIRYRDILDSIKLHFMNSETYYINKYVKLLRKEETLNSATLVGDLHRILVSRKKNKLGLKLGFLIPPNTIGRDCMIWHTRIVINANASIGHGCIFHGDNCIGNDGSSSQAPAPVIGNHVELGFGASIIGNVHIADNCVIGAGAVVTHSFETPGSVIAGIPAKVIRYKEDD